MESEDGEEELLSLPLVKIKLHLELQDSISDDGRMNSILDWHVIPKY